MKKQKKEQNENYIVYICIGVVTAGMIVSICALM